MELFPRAVILGLYVCMNNKSTGVYTAERLCFTSQRAMAFFLIYHDSTPNAYIVNTCNRVYRHFINQLKLDLHWGGGNSSAKG